MARDINCDPFLKWLQLNGVQHVLYVVVVALVSFMTRQALCCNAQVTEAASWDLVSDTNIRTPTNSPNTQSMARFDNWGMKHSSNETFRCEMLNSFKCVKQLTIHQQCGFKMWNQCQMARG